MGAPKGNTNALKHGLYAKHFSPEEQTRLRKMSPEDYRHEIAMMRLAVSNLFQIQVQLHKMVEEALRDKQSCDVEALSKISNSLSLAVTALNTVARTHALLNGTDTSVNDAFEDALNGLSIFLDEPTLSEARVDKEDQEEILVE